jgi:hypothetical protein
MVAGSKTFNRVAVMHNGVVRLVPPGQSPEAFAKARGWELAGADAALSVAMSDSARTGAGGGDTAAAFIERNLREQVRTGALITARTAAARLGAAGFTDALGRAALVVHAVGRRRYEAAADVAALERAQSRPGAAATTAEQSNARTPATRPTRKRRPLPDWMR